MEEGLDQVDNKLSGSGLINGGCEETPHRESFNNEMEETEANSDNQPKLKHARFKITSHSKTNINSDDEVPNGNIADHDYLNSNIPLSLLKRRQSQNDGSTLGYATIEAVPMSVFYRNENSLSNCTDNYNKQRPTLDELHKGNEEIDGRRTKVPVTSLSSPEDTVKVDIVERNTNTRPPSKIGWVRGVLFPCLLNIWGVIMFLRLSWIVGQAGTGLSLVIVGLATVLTLITSVSMSAICTNGQVKGGGAYYLISRSLGPDFGGSIGIIFSMANAVAVALYLVGFAETVRDLMTRYGTKIFDEINDIRIVGIAGLILLFLVTLVGLEWVVYTQIFLLITLVAAMLCVVAGTFYPGADKSRELIRSYGILGYNYDLFEENFFPKYRDGNHFFSVFSIFFPAATGILAGANLSGDLKNPSQAIPNGTITAIIVTSITYMIMAILVGATVERDASGILLSSIINGTANSCVIGSCKFGLMNDFQLLEKLSIWGPVVTAGIFAATLSSALASLVSAPKVFQAVCKDSIFPGIKMFGKGFGHNGEPRRSYILTFFIAVGFISIGELNVIAPIISNFFLMAYALINYCVFAGSLAKSPGWRPAFKYYNKWISLLGFIMCIFIMFFVNWWAALTTVICVAGLYKYVDYRKPDINWGSSGQAHTYLKALRFTRRLDRVEEHVKNFRVQCLVLSGQPSQRPNLVHFVSHITKHYGLMVCGDVTITESLRPPVWNDNVWLKKHRVKAFHQITQNPSLRAGVSSLLQCCGLGKLRPNTLVLGYMTKWQASPVAKVEDYVGMIHDAFDLNYGVSILRLQDGFDITEDLEEDEENIFANQEPDWYTEDWDESQIPNHNKTEQSSNSESSEVNQVNQGKPSVNPEIVIAFDKKRKGTIDVWWLYDDGGLTILIPHLLSISNHWRGNKLRIFTPASDKKIKANQIRMANLLKKFRIDFSSVVEFRGINKAPNEESMKAFKKFRDGEHLGEDNVLDKKTQRQIRLGELVREHSHDAKLIILTLPIPKKAVVSSLMYMSWLEVLSAELPPILLLRGNQQSVLTYYS